jgi:probable HAF family extracellular repeat protein
LTTIQRRTERCKKIKNKSIILLSVLLVLVISSVSSALANGWTLTVLEDITNGAGRYYPHDINDHGQIVGAAITSDNLSHAVYWENGKIKDLGLLNGHGSQANSINNIGQISGFSKLQSRALLWNSSDSPMQDLGRFMDGNKINNVGQILGAVNYYDSSFHPAIRNADGTVIESYVVQCPELPVPKD